MIDWGDARFLILGVAFLAILVALYARARRKRRWALAEMVGPHLGGRLAATVHERAVRWRTGLRFVALAALMIAAAGPRWGRQVVKVSGQGSDLVFVVDVSYSMDARDVPPSRIEEAKREATTLLDGLTGDRVALVAFAGDAAVLTPLTLDYSAVRILLGSLSTSTVSRAGSDLGRALQAALDLLPKSRPGEQAIVVFTDGEDLGAAGQAVALTAARKGIRVFTVGVGTPAGQTIPVYDEGGRQIGVKRGPDGQVVLSRLNEDLLRDIARRTRGAYFAASHPGGEVTRLRRAVARVERGKREGRLGTRPVERFALFAWIAWLAWVASLWLPARRSLPALDAARKGLAAAIALALLSTASPARAGPLEDGNKAYAQGDYRAAAAAYRRGLAKRPGDPKLLANLGSALYRQRDFQGAETSLSQAAASGHGRLSDRELGRVLYNYGNALFRTEKWAEAADAYRRSLERAPNDADTRFNYEAALARLQPPPPEPPNSGGGGGGESEGGGNAAQPPPSPSQPKGAPQLPQRNAQRAAAGRLTRQDAERLLDALGNEEAETQKKKNKARAVVEPKGPDW